MKQNGFYPDFKNDEIGYSVRPSNDRIIIMIEIYKKEKTKEALDKMMLAKDVIKNQIYRLKGEGVEVNVIDALEVLKQIDKHTNVKSDTCIEVIDLLTGEFVPIELIVEK